MKKLVIMLAAFLGLLISTTAFAKAAPFMKPHHKDIPCSACHAKERPGVLIEGACSTCHGSPEEMAEATRALKHNPHESIHWGTALPCEECHKQHKEPRFYCGESCHYWPDVNVK